ncbi:MAG: F0F1 ATP synthase subunit delta [Muribaculaceae bacterium]|nr:F0F1 ATP synthase subunit delta [Muribaculaceae bacterium]
MDNGLIPQRYAKALYKFALEHDNTVEVYDLAKTVIGSFETNPALQKAIANPNVKTTDKERLLLAAAGNEADEAYKRFVKLVIEHKREEFFWRMMIAYRDIYRKANNIAQVKIITAATLPDSEMERLRKLVGDSFKGMSLEFSESVNPDLIGGFIIDVDSVRMDASVSNELEQLRQTLLRSK